MDMSGAPPLGALSEGGPLWTEEMAVGVEAIDEEHRHFLWLLDRFNHETSAGSAAIYDMLAEVLLYTERHFTHEEAVMREVGYPFLDDHHVMHDRAEEQVHQLAADDVSEEEIRAYLGRFMLNWLVLHIRSADRKFAEWLCAEKAARDASHSA